MGVTGLTLDSEHNMVAWNIGIWMGKEVNEKNHWRRKCVGREYFHNEEYIVCNNAAGSLCDC